LHMLVVNAHCLFVEGPCIYMAFQGPTAVLCR